MGTVFSTLEPCAPGARQAPKVSCAERIVRARIKEVWIGIEDPDPTVDRKGIRYLQDNGVSVHLFDPDLQREIRDQNGLFLEQAVARADAWQNEPTALAERLSELFFEMVREAIVNAIIHRDYGVAGAKCQVAVTRDSVTVMSPGLPVEPITLKQMQSLDAPMLSRNPVLHYVFSQMRLAEERGLGLKSLRLRAEGAGVPLPRYRWRAPYLELSIYRSAAGLARDLTGPAVMDDLGDAATTSWRVAALRDTISTRELMSGTGFDERKTQRALKTLEEAGLLRRVGNGRATRFEIAY